MIHVESQYSCLQELKRCSMLYTSLAAAWLTCIGFTSLPCDEILWMPVILVPFIFQFFLGFSQAIFPLCLFTKPTSVSIHGSWLISVCYPSPKNYSLFLHKMSKFSFFILFFFSPCHLQLENRNLLSQTATLVHAFLNAFLLCYFPVF